MFVVLQPSNRRLSQLIALAICTSVHITAPQLIERQTSYGLTASPCPVWRKLPHEQVSRYLLSPAHLVHKERHARLRALIAQGPRPFRLHWTRALTLLTGTDDQDALLHQEVVRQDHRPEARRDGDIDGQTASRKRAHMRPELVELFLALCAEAKSEVVPAPLTALARLFGCRSFPRRLEAI